MRHLLDVLGLCVGCVLVAWGGGDVVIAAGAGLAVALVWEGGG
jgi:hypothetical protein